MTWRGVVVESALPCVPCVSARSGTAPGGWVAQGVDREVGGGGRSPEMGLHPRRVHGSSCGWGTRHVSTRRVRHSPSPMGRLGGRGTHPHPLGLGHCPTPPTPSTILWGRAPAAPPAAACAGTCGRGGVGGGGGRAAKRPGCGADAAPPEKNPDGPPPLRLVTRPGRKGGDPPGGARGFRIRRAPARTTPHPRAVGGGGVSWINTQT